MSLSEEPFISRVGSRGIQTPTVVRSPLALKASHTLLRRSRWRTLSLREHSGYSAKSGLPPCQSLDLLLYPKLCRSRTAPGVAECHIPVSLDLGALALSLDLGWCRDWSTEKTKQIVTHELCLDVHGE